MGDDSELNIPQLIQIALCGVEAIYDTVYADDEEDAPEDDKQLWLNLREQLRELLRRVNTGLITPEYAEVELDKIQAAQDQWVRDNPIPP